MKKPHNHFKSAMSPSYLALKNKGKVIPEKISLFLKATYKLRNIEPWLVLVAITAFGLDLYGQYENRKQWEIERAAIQEERLARYWQIATAPIDGNSGKQKAFEFLHKNGEEFPGIYIPRTNLSGVTLPNVNFNGSNLERVNFSNSNLDFSSFKSGYLRGVNFLNTSLIGANFLKADLSNARMAFISDLMRRENRFIHPNFKEANISGLIVYLTWPKEPTDVSNLGNLFNKSWFWSDNCPKLSTRKTQRGKWGKTESFVSPIDICKNTGFKVMKFIEYPSPKFKQDVEIYGSWFAISNCRAKPKATTKNPTTGLKLRRPCPERAKTLKIDSKFRSLYNRYQNYGFPDIKCLVDMDKLKSKLATPCPTPRIRSIGRG